MRGSCSVFTKLVSPPPAASGKSKGKGRNAQLCAARNEKICARFYYYLMVAAGPRPAYDEVVNMLAADYFLSPVTVAAIIQSGADQIARLKADKPGREFFVRRWPSRVWPPAKETQKAS